MHALSFHSDVKKKRRRNLITFLFARPPLDSLFPLRCSSLPPSFFLFHHHALFYTRDPFQPNVLSTTSACDCLYFWWCFRCLFPERRVPRSVAAKRSRFSPPPPLSSRCTSIGPGPHRSRSATTWAWAWVSLAPRKEEGNSLLSARCETGREGEERRGREKKRKRVRERSHGGAEQKRKEEEEAGASWECSLSLLRSLRLLFYSNSRSIPAYRGDRLSEERT